MGPKIRGIAAAVFVMSLPFAAQAAEPNPARFADMPQLNLMEAPFVAPAAQARARIQKASAAGKGQAYFDWLAPKRANSQLQIKTASATRKSLGRGSWICSPAGFGKKSSCYRR